MEGKCIVGRYGVPVPPSGVVHDRMGRDRMGQDLGILVIPIY